MYKVAITGNRTELLLTLDKGTRHGINYHSYSKAKKEFDKVVEYYQKAYTKSARDINPMVVHLVEMKESKII